MNKTYLNIYLKLKLILNYYYIIILFIVQCWTQASKPEALKQGTQKEKANKLIFKTLK